MIKEIWCMSHSHLDIGYTHPQPLIMELQSDYLDQAMELIEKTRNYPEEAQFRWTIEASCVLKRWLKTAAQEQIVRLRRHIKEGRICVTALPMHTTPGVDASELVYMLSDLRELEQELEMEIKVAVNHDVNGQPWTLGQLLIDSGIDFYLTGINTHFGGIPFPRMTFFQWEMSDGRRLPSFIGEHYSMFSQFIRSWEPSTDTMHKGLTEYVKWMEDQGYERDFLFLTATNPPLYDNNPPDWELPELICRYNKENPELKIRFVTADMLRDRLLQEEAVPVHKGDWTDYWNFGCASTARETRVNRLGKDLLQTAQMLECFTLEKDRHYECVKEECRESMVIYDEHTWGASQSVSEPESPETFCQLNYKLQNAYKAADLSSYMLSRQMEQYCRNPYQSDKLEGVAVVNPTAYSQTFQVQFPKDYLEEKRHIGAHRSKYYVPYLEKTEPVENCGVMTLPPYTVKTMPFEALREIQKESSVLKENYNLENHVLTTPFYRVYLDESTGGIRQIVDQKSGREILSSESGYDFFEAVRETVDTQWNEAVRETMYGARNEVNDHDKSHWNHEWKAKHTKRSSCSWHAERQEYQISIVTEGFMEGTRGIRQKITFYTYRPDIRMEAAFYKEPVSEPESLMFVIPLKMSEGWQCSYDTAGEMVRLDEEQLGFSCRDYLTVDTGVSMYDDRMCVTLSCPDAPMVQVGNFQFAKENRSIERKENPLLAAWPLNNYWSTNFCANQSGRMTFAYELNLHEQFREQSMHSDGIRAKHPVIIGAAVKAVEEEQRLLELQGESTVLSVSPSKNHDGIHILLKNNTKQKDICYLKSSVWKIREAERISPPEESLEILETEGDRVRIMMQPGTMKLIHLKAEMHKWKK